MRTFLYRMRRYRGLILLVLSGFIVPLLTNLFSGWLEKSVGETPTRMAQLVAIGVAATVALGGLYLALSRERREWVLVPKEKRPPQFPGLIVLVGPGREEEDPLQGPCGPAIEYHLPTLKFCWMIASEEGQPVAEALRQQYEGRCQVKVVPVGGAFEVQDVYETVRNIYLQEAPKAGLAPEQVIADFTGGTKVMSAGMILACGDRWPMQYMSGRKGAKSAPIFIQFQP